MLPSSYWKLLINFSHLFKSLFGLRRISSQWLSVRSHWLRLLWELLSPEILPASLGSARCATQNRGSGFAQSALLQWAYLHKRESGDINQIAPSSRWCKSSPISVSPQLCEEEDRGEIWMPPKPNRLSMQKLVNFKGHVALMLPWLCLCISLCQVNLNCCCSLLFAYTIKYLRHKMWKIQRCRNTSQVKSFLI